MTIMETTKLRRFAQYARRTLMELVAARVQLVLQAGSAARRENTEAIRKLEEAIKSYGEAHVVERVAYTWFNRFCALRFMDVNRYTRIGVVSPAEGQFQPEILAEAKMGHIDDETVPEEIRQQITALLADRVPSHDPQGEAYRLLVVAACNAFHRAMPFLFERIDDYTELLMPDDLLSGNSILAYTREAMTPDACKDVEVIGWLYQFYISEKKDAVFEGLKKNQKITPENIPAATQLFTPHWIVRYLVENSLGRLWLLNRPGSKLAEQMDYYIQPEQPEIDFLKITAPEEIKICDPACGSGHMLTYAFDLLYSIYEEEGYEPGEIPEKILTHNLYGIEIDERAGELAAFALIMKAAGCFKGSKQRRFFNKSIKPNICVLENVKFDANELAEYMGFIGRDLFTASLQITLSQFEEASNFGSLIRPDVTNVDSMLRTLEGKDVSGQLFLSETHKKVLLALRQADYLSPKYLVVIANPPYMGSKGMNGRLAAWARDCFPNSKSDLFAMFLERGLDMVPKFGFSAMVTMQSWMFLSAYEKLRRKLITQAPIVSMAHLGNMVMGIAFGTSATVFKNRGSQNSVGSYCYVEWNNISKDGYPYSFPPSNNRNKNTNEQGYYLVTACDFEKIPDSPIAYWFGDAGFAIFEKSPLLEQVASVKTGMTTADNARFVRIWNEIDIKKAAFKVADGREAEKSGKKWFPYNKGGGFRKWYGFNDNLINWELNGREIKENVDENGKRRAYVRAEEFYFKPAITYSAVTSGSFSARVSDVGFLFDSGGSSVFCKSETELNVVSGVLCSKLPEFFLSAYNDTINFQPGDVSRIPISSHNEKNVEHISSAVQTCVQLSRADWDSCETSWDFASLPLLSHGFHQSTIKATYQKLRAHWLVMTLEMQRLEEENNRIFIHAYGLQRELKSDVLLNEITLTCNPRFRYGGDKSEDELEVMLMADTMRELVSYAVGCMFGRYSLDKPGLILANQGETLEDYLCQVTEPRFTPDADNVIPLLNGDWFPDDITGRFREFLRVTFGGEHYDENLHFIEAALGKRDKPLPIRDYFLKDFYNDHVKRYKKRPIYWLFSSPKGTFNALIYLHRYRQDTASVVLNGYLRDFRNKLAAHLSYLQQVGISATASQAEKTRVNKEIDTVKKQLQELDDYERDVLYPLATEQVSLDLDDGVKANYLKLGPALKKIVGLDAKEED